MSETESHDGLPEMSLRQFVGEWKQKPVLGGALWLLVMILVPLVIPNDDVTTGMKLALLGSWAVIVGGVSAIGLVAWGWARANAMAAWDAYIALVMANQLATAFAVAAAGVVFVVVGFWVEKREVPDDV